MITDVYQTSAEAQASDTYGSPQQISTFVLVFLPPRADFSAQISLCRNDCTTFPRPGSVPQFNAGAFIARYISYKGGALESTWIGDVPGGNVVSHVKEGYAVQFGMTVDAQCAEVSAEMTGTIFLES